MRIIVIAALLTWIAPACADETSVRAEQIIRQMEDLYRGTSSRGEITMQIKTPRYERTLELSTKNLGEDTAFIRILSPRKDRGITTLRLGKEMWNYFPKIDKVIKVPPSMMMGSWMGSDFTNDDLVQQTELTEEYDLALTETPETFEISLTPKADTVTVWGRIEYVVDRERLVPIRQIYFDDDDTMVRKLEFSELRDFDGRRLPSRLEMIPLGKEEHRTVVTYKSIEFDPPDVDSGDFTLRALQSRF